ncbi:MAG: cold shock domain-containing protein [Paracoccaceae bacterium]
MITGLVKWFDAGKGYGFILVEDEGGDILLHANVLRNFGRGSISEGAEVSFSVQQTERGRQVAEIYEISAPAETETDEEARMAMPDVGDAPLVPARVKWFDKVKGFGFANVFGSSEDIFLHMEILRHYGFSDLAPGEALSLQVVDGPRGQMAGAIYSWDRPLLLAKTPHK